MLKYLLLTIGLLFSAVSAFASPEKYKIDASHAQVVFSYNHLGFSNTSGMFSGFEGEVMFDADNPAHSSVIVAMPVMSMFTGWEARDGHFMSDDFFGAKEGDMITFSSTKIEVLDDKTAHIIGDLSMNGVTRPVVLTTKLNKSAPYPFGPKAGTSTLGFDATTTLLRSDFNLGAFAPAVSDEVDVRISIEAMKDG
ncbi:MAG: YceI family protein [Aestuariivita sp.]|nr:YceI family protein [Aestuariivita sp.]